MSIISETSPGLGVGIRETIVRAKASVAATKGDVHQFDFTQTSATNSNIGDPNSCFVVTKVPAANAVFGACFAGVWLESVAAGGFGRMLLRGVVEANAWQASTGVTKGKALGLDVVTPSAKLVGLGTGSRRCVAIALTASSASALDAPNAETIKVLFNGVEGIGLTP